MPRKVFLAVRLPLLTVLLAVLLFCGLGFGGWSVYNSIFPPDLAARLQQTLQKNLRGIRTYYARMKTTLVAVEKGPQFLIEMWSSAPDRYRLELTRLQEGEQVGLQVLVRDGDKAFYYEPALGQFYPVHDLGLLQLDQYFPDNFWQDLCEAAYFEVVAQVKGTRHNYHLVEVVPKQPYRLRALDMIWLEEGTMLPVRVESYDANRLLSQVTVFEILQLNPFLEATLFEIDERSFRETQGTISR